MAKAYITSLPNTTDTQRTFVKTVDTPKVPAMDYRSGFNDVASAINNTNKFLSDYSKMKYEGFQADLDKLELEHLHEMQDAKDPCELEEINEKWKKNYDSALKDDFWAKSYYKSKYYKNWQDRNQKAQQKIYFEKQHEFAEICATDTLNKMAETASMLDNPSDVQQYLVNGEAMLANTKHLTAENRYKLMANFYKDTVSRLYNSDPNKAVAFLDSVGNKYDGYGVSSEEIRNKADDYNKARERERQADIARAEKQRVSMEKTNGLALAQAVALGKISESEATLLAENLSPEGWNEYRKASPKKSATSKTETDYTQIHNVFLSDSEDKIGDWNNYKLNHPELSPSQITRGDNLAKTFETKETQSKNPITVADEIKVGQVESGELTMSDKDIEASSHGNASLAKEFRTARNNYNKTIAKQLEEQNKQKAAEQKKEAEEEKKKAQEKSDLAMAKINLASDEEVAKVVRENIPNLTSKDLAVATGKVKTARDKINERIEKAQGEKKKLLEEQAKELKTVEQNANFNIMSDYISKDPKAYSLDEINKAYITQNQKEKLKNQIKSSTKEQEERQKKVLSDYRRELKGNLSAQWEQGKIITNIDDFLNNYPYADNENRGQLYNYIVDGNSKVAKANWAKVENDFFKFIQQNNNVTDENLENYINNLDNTYTGKNYQEMYDDLDKIRKGFENQARDEMKNALSNFDTIWGQPQFGEETQLEKIKKAEAKTYYMNLLNNNINNTSGFDKYTNIEFIRKVVSTYKPTKDNVYDYLNNKDSAIGVIDNLKRDMFDEKTKLPKKKLSYNDLIRYNVVVNNAFKQGFISQTEKMKNLTPIQEPLAVAFDEASKKDKTVLGRVVNRIKAEILGENYNPAEMVENVNFILSTFELPADGDVETGFFNWFGDKEPVIEDRNSRIEQGIVILKERYKQDKNVNAIARGGQIITLGGTK